MIETPEPLTPPECDLSDYPWMPLDIKRLRRSKSWKLAKREPELAFYMINLWVESWHEVPAASLEDDDDDLADIAGCSDPSLWKELKPKIMRGWVKCSDGRLYHPVVAEKAKEAWELKLDQRGRTEAARRAAAEKREAKRLAREQAKREDEAKTENGSGGQDYEAERPPAQALMEPETTTESVTESVTDLVTEVVTDLVTASTVQDSTRQERKKESGSFATDAPGASDVRRRDARKVLWDEGVPIVRRLTGKPEGPSRTLLGRLLRDARDDCAALIALLREAEEMHPIDPVAWLSEAARCRGAKAGSIQRVIDDWGLMSLDELDANAARLMAIGGNA